MGLNEILAIITPIISGICGIVFSVIVLLRKIRSAIKIARESLKDHELMEEELKSIRATMNDLKMQTNFVVEQVKTAAKNEKAKQK